MKSSEIDNLSREGHADNELRRAEYTVWRDPRRRYVGHGATLAEARERALEAWRKANDTDV